MNPDFPPVWMTYVNVDNADATVAKVSAAGGTVFVPPMDVMDAGRMGIVADPLGAVIGLWQPKAAHGCQLVNEPGTFCWNELITTDLDARRPSTRRSSDGAPRTRALPAARRRTPSGSSGGGPWAA